MNWHVTDSRVLDYVNAGIVPIIEVSEGTTNGLPTYKGEVADPNVIGADLYLAYQYRFARAAVNRYKKYCYLYQIENELNEAWLAGFAGQRRLDLGGYWRNTTFTTQLLSVLNSAVKDEQPEAWTTTNLHTDIPEFVHQALSLPGYFVDAAKVSCCFWNACSIFKYFFIYMLAWACGVHLHQPYR